MDNQIKLFNSPQFGQIRTAGTPENPQFCLADICRVLEIGNPSQVKSRLGDGVITNEVIIDSLGREQVAVFINEDGLYDVILDSRKPEARAFRKWITSEVLPEIRKSGGYMVVSEQDSDMDIMARALMIAQKTIENRDQRIQMLEGERDLLQTQNKLMAPKARYTDEVLQSTSTITFTELAKELNFRSAHAMLEKLVAARILYRQSGRYLPMAKYSDKGYFDCRVHRFLYNDGTIGTNTSTVVTEKGRQFFHAYFNKLS